MAGKALGGVALITGAASGIGKETATSLAEAGVAGIVFADLSDCEEAAKQSKQYATHPDYRVLVLRVDVADESSVQTMVDETVKEFGRIDYSVNCAGVGVDAYTPFNDSSVEELEKLFSINAKGTMICLRTVCQAMVKQEPVTVVGRHGPRNIGRGSIINLASALSYVAVPGALTYCVSKHAVLGITKSAAVDNFAHGIRVNAVCPTWVNTPMMESDFQKAPPLKEMVNKASPLGRMAEPEEIADVIAFLCSPSASYINGTGLIVDSGVTLTLHLG